MDEKNFQILRLTGELIYVCSYYTIIPSFQSRYLVLQLMKQWLTVVNFVLIVVSNYLTTVKQCLTIYFFQKLYVIGKISIRWSEKKHKTIEKVEMLKISTVNPLV